MANISKGDKPEEIEITPEMIEAGVAVLVQFYGEAGEPREFLRQAVEEVFLAMAVGKVCQSHQQENSAPLSAI